MTGWRPKLGQCALGAHPTNFVQTKRRRLTLGGREAPSRREGRALPEPHVARAKVHSHTRQNPTAAIPTQYRRYADVQKSPKLPLLERRAFPLPAAGHAPREMQDIGG